ncbi:hypothetical protein GS934_04060 [Rhodococcus hoagii]|nr:hypothetical protein [Prescottella equi]NKZ87105.1 hypothetical protein [Prescottella equi]
MFTAGAGFLGSTATAKSIMVIDPVVVDVTTTTTLTVPPTAETGQQITLRRIWIRPTPPARCSSRTAPPTSVDRWP